MDCETTTFLSVFILSNACGDGNPLRWGRHLPPDPTHSVSTLPTGRPAGHLRRLPETFNPGTLLSFYLQGFVPPRDPNPLPDSILPCRFQSGSPRAPHRSASKVSSPWKSVFHWPMFPPNLEPIPSWLSPFEVFSSTAVGPASRPYPPTRFPPKPEPRSWISAQHPGVLSTMESVYPDHRRNDNRHQPL